MASEARTFLAAAVLNDEKIISYRSLSRELKVHNNVAKKMLFEFHHVQNSKNPGSVHATYLLDGIPLVQKESSLDRHQPDGDDVHMQSSPYMSSSMPQQHSEVEKVPSRKILLAGEENFEASRAKFEEIHSVHVYSLEPAMVQNPQILAECNRAISAKYLTEDPLIVGKQYGVIHNTDVRRRNGKRPNLPAPVVKNSEKANIKTQQVIPEIQNSQSPYRSLSSGKAGKSATRADDRRMTMQSINPPATSKQENSEFFRSIPKPEAKLAQKDTESHNRASSTSKKREPQEMNQKEDDDATGETSEEEKEDDFVETNKSKVRTGKSRSEREEELRHMMDDNDESMEEDTEHSPEVSHESESMGVPVPQKAAASPEPPVVVVEGGRRRGRRRIMKKKTMKDEEGYLVTKEEPAWESFSEDELFPPKERAPASTPSSSSAAKGKKLSGKPGQGNIMSFFGKK